MMHWKIPALWDALEELSKNALVFVVCNVAVFSLRFELATLCLKAKQGLVGQACYTRSTSFY